MLRPIREDHPHFDGSNSASVPPDLTNTEPVDAIAGQIAIPYWEVVGPWDVDNDNDGIAGQHLGRPGRPGAGGRRRHALQGAVRVPVHRPRQPAERQRARAGGSYHAIPTIRTLLSRSCPMSRLPAWEQEMGPIWRARPARLRRLPQFSTDQLAHRLGLQRGGDQPAAGVCGPVGECRREQPLKAIGSRTRTATATVTSPTRRWIATRPSLAGRVKLGGEGVPGRYGYDEPRLLAEAVRRARA